jgi:hypothetical protein
MRPRQWTPTALIAAIGFLAAACSDAPTDSPAELAGPQFAKGGNKPPADPSITFEFSDDAVYNIRNDTRGIYVDGECGVKATFNINDARLDPDAKKIRRNDETACGGRQARSVKVTLTPTEDSPFHELDGTTQDGNFFKVDDVELVTAGTEAKAVVIHGPFGCALGLRFNYDLDPESNFVDVTKNPNGSWTVTTQPDDNDVAVCLPDGNPNAGPPRYYHMPFEVTVALKP